MSRAALPGELPDTSIPHRQYGVPHARSRDRGFFGSLIILTAGIFALQYSGAALPAEGSISIDTAKGNVGQEIRLPIHIVSADSSGDGTITLRGKFHLE